MSKYCPECKQNFSDAFYECVYCGATLVEGTVYSEEKPSAEKQPKTISQMTNDEILENYKDYRTKIELQMGKLSDEQFIQGIRSGYQDKVEYMSENIRIPEQSHNSTPTVMCPYCGSTNTKKITATSRVVDSLIWGFFSPKRSKQWYCNDCKSDF